MTKFCVGSEHLEVQNGVNVELKYYILKQEKFYTELNESYVSYGLEIEEKAIDFYDRDFVEDITCDSKIIDFMSCKLKENKVLPVHLKDIIIDMLS